MINKHAIFIDLDGTLLNEQEKISPFTKTIINRVVQQKIDVILCTGKSYLKAFGYYQELALTTPLITSGGLLISHPHDQTFQVSNKTIDVETIFQIFNLTWLKKVVKLFLIETPLSIFYDGELKGNLHHLLCHPDLKIEKLPQFSKILPIINVYLELKIDIDETSAKGLVEKIQKIFPQVKVEYWLTGQNLILNISDRQVSKGYALETLRNLYHYQEIWAYGNGWTDRSMLQVADVGIAMANSLPELKNFAKAVTKFSNQDDGVAHDIAMRLWNEH